MTELIKTLEKALATAAIIEGTGENLGKVLLVTRHRDRAEGGKLALVSGRAAFQELTDIVKAVKLEVRFDLGLEFLEPELFAANFEDYSGQNLTLYFTGRIEGTPNPKEGFITEVGWYGALDINQRELAFDHKRVLLKYFSELYDSP